VNRCLDLGTDLSPGATWFDYVVVAYPQCVKHYAAPPLFNAQFRIVASCPTRKAALAAKRLLSLPDGPA
jgi:hypothetical protein